MNDKLKVAVAFLTGAITFIGEEQNGSKLARALIDYLQDIEKCEPSEATALAAAAGLIVFK